MFGLYLLLRGGVWDDVDREGGCVPPDPPGAGPHERRRCVPVIGAQEDGSVGNIRARRINIARLPGSVGLPDVAKVCGSVPVGSWLPGAARGLGVAVVGPAVRPAILRGWPGEVTKKLPILVVFTVATAPSRRPGGILSEIKHHVRLPPPQTRFRPGSPSRGPSAVLRPPPGYRPSILHRRGSSHQHFAWIPGCRVSASSCADRSQSRPFPAGSWHSTLSRIPGWTSPICLVGWMRLHEGALPPVSRSRDRPAGSIFSERGVVRASPGRPTDRVVLYSVARLHRRPQEYVPDRGRSRTRPPSEDYGPPVRCRSIALLSCVMWSRTEARKDYFRRHPFFLSISTLSATPKPLASGKVRHRPATVGSPGLGRDQDLDGGSGWPCYRQGGGVSVTRNRFSLPGRATDNRAEEGLAAAVLSAFPGYAIARCKVLFKSRSDIARPNESGCPTICIRCLGELGHGLARRHWPPVRSDGAKRETNCQVGRYRRFAA